MRVKSVTDVIMRPSMIDIVMCDNVMCDIVMCDNDTYTKMTRIILHDISHSHCHTTSCSRSHQIVQWTDRHCLQSLSLRQVADIGSKVEALSLLSLM